MGFLLPTVENFVSQALTSAAQAAIAKYNLAFQVCPIILQAGIAQNAQGGILPIIALYGQLDLFKTATDVNQFFAQYLPLPGSTLIEQSIAAVPFANQQVAANAVIQEPLTLSMLMIAPVNQPGGYISKLAQWTAIQNALQAHNNSGGYYSVATPAFVYNNLLMTRMAHLPTPEGRQQMIEYQIDFVAPLITLQQAQAAQGKLMGLISSGGQTNGAPTWSGSAQAQSTVANGLTGALSQFGASSSPVVQAAITSSFAGS